MVFKWRIWMKKEIEPLVSVVISCFNHEDYIEASILSVLNQSYKNIELIVFDDGSVDSSVSIIAALSKRHGFFFRSQENIGYTATLNKSIKLCKGKYIAFLGSDDLFFEEKIEKQVQFMECRSDIAVCGGNMVHIDGSGRVLEKQKKNPYSEVDFITIFNNRKAGPPASSAMIRTDVLREVGGYDPTIGLEDLYIWMKITYHGYKLAILDDDLIFYRKHGLNASKQYKFMSDSIIEIYDQYSSEKDYQVAINKVLISMFLKTAKLDRRYALNLLKRISPRFYSFKVLRGIFALIKPKLIQK